MTKSESSSASSSASSSSAASSCGDVIRETVEVEVNKRRSPKSSAKGARPPSSAISSVTSTSSSTGSSSSSRSSYSSPGSARKFRRQQESRSGIYSSKISQQVFVHEPSKASKRDSAATSRGSTIKTAKSTHSSVLKQQNKQQVVPPEDFQGELKDKCMTFFSSVRDEDQGGRRERQNKVMIRLCAVLVSDDLRGKETKCSRASVRGVANWQSSPLEFPKSHRHGMLSSRSSNFM